ncbi:uncharacterized membrane protein YhaH (DUF805 family) [Sphingomonas sp. UYAg733]
MDLLTRPWRHYFDFKGRSRRLECLLFWVSFYAILFLVALLVILMNGVTGLAGQGIIQPGYTAALFCLASVIPALSLSVRRLHDLGISGWWLLIWFAPLIGQILGGLLSLIIIFIPSPGGENQYGYDPRDPAAPDENEELDRIFA